MAIGAVRWTAEFGLDVSDAIDVDLRTYKPQPPAEPFRVDVVVPFHDGDADFLPECLRGLSAQEHVSADVHVISDGSRWPQLPAGVSHGAARFHYYETPGGWGPYRITNAVFPFLRSDLLAIQDADDISLPQRLWRQAATLQATGCEMISSAAWNFYHSPADRDSCRQTPAIVRPGRVTKSTPFGTCVNGTRMICRDTFERLNGFADIPASGDYQFDGRAGGAGVHIYHDQTILLRRRLHIASNTNGPLRIGSNKRVELNGVMRHDVDSMRLSPTLANAQRLGALRDATAGDGLVCLNNREAFTADSVDTLTTVGG